MKKGYRIKIFNTINFGKPMYYNSFHYIHSEKNILKLVTTLMTNTRGEGKGVTLLGQSGKALAYVVDRLYPL